MATLPYSQWDPKEHISVKFYDNDSNVFFQGKALENAVCKMVAILSWPQFAEEWKYKLWYTAILISCHTNDYELYALAMPHIILNHTNCKYACNLPSKDIISLYFMARSIS